MSKAVLLMATVAVLVSAVFAMGGLSSADPVVHASDLPVRARLPLLAADTAPVQATPSPTATSPVATATKPATTATATSPATATPSPTTVPQPTGVYTRSAAWYVAEYTGTIHVVGLVINGTSSPVGYVKITANFEGSGGQLLATDFTFSQVTTIPAGGSSPFDVLLFEPPPGITAVSVQVTDYDTTPFQPPVAGLSASVTNSYRSITGTVHVVGTVTNSSGMTYKYVQPVGAFLDASGTVIRTDFTFTSPDTLAPGATGTFDMLFFDAPSGMELGNFLIWVDADR